MQQKHFTKILRIQKNYAKKLNEAPNETPYLDL